MTDEPEIIALTDEAALFDQAPEIMSGALVFRGTRVPVSVLFDNLIARLSLGEIDEHFPTIGMERAQATIRLAGLRLTERYHAR